MIIRTAKDVIKQEDSAKAEELSRLISTAKAESENHSAEVSEIEASVSKFSERAKSCLSHVPWSEAALSAAVREQGA
jgi:hypothetical protein